MPDPNEPDLIKRLANSQLAAEITCSIDDGHSEVVNLLESLDAASEYILCLRQLVYSNIPEVIESARERADKLGSRWYVFQKRLEELPRKYDCSTSSDVASNDGERDE